MTDSKNWKYGSQASSGDHKELDIPRSTVARLANMHATEVSAWLGWKMTFSQEKIERITQSFPLQI